MINTPAYIHMSIYVDHMITKNRQVRVLFATKGPQRCAQTVAIKAAHEDKSKSN